MGKIARPLPPPKSIPDPGSTSIDFEHDMPSENPDLNHHQRESKNVSYSQLGGPHGNFAVPTMEELGLKSTAAKHRGGEQIALKMLNAVIKDEHYTATFEKPKTAPTAFEPQATTLLSPHLHFGSLSCREFYWRVSDVVDNFKGKASQPPFSLTGQLLFRDMYFGAQAKLGWKFGQTIGNSYCRFIPWHLRSKVDETGLATGEYIKDSGQAEDWFRRWKFGKTGFPWIDAVMRQLRQEGWIHHLARHAVACFLTRGGCYIDWERGAEVFEEWLIDHESACNIGNWQWLSCSAFYAQYYRCYSPIAFPQKTDKDGDFVRRYVPELKDFAPKYIYEPWKAPIQDQKRAGCIIKGDGTESRTDDMLTYPKPMFDFSERRTICIDGMKNAYHIDLYGNDPKVLDGTWQKLFDNSAEGDTTSRSKGDVTKDGAMVKHSEDLQDSDSGHEANEPARKGTAKNEKQIDTKRKRASSGNETLDKFVTPRKAKR